MEPKLIGTILFDNSERTFDNWDNPDDFLAWVFYVNNFNGKLINGSPEGIPKWLSERELDALKKSAGDSKLYEWIKSSKYFTGVIKHQGYQLDEEKTFVNYFDTPTQS